MFFEQCKKRLWLVVLVALLPLVAASQTISPEEIRAQYIIKMRPFVQLGHPPRSIREICYYEEPGVPEDKSVGQLVAKSLRVHRTKEMSVKWLKAIHEFVGCDILFIPESEDDSIDNIIAALGDSEILTISSAKQFIHRGGMIGFIFDDENRVKMEANLKNAKAKNVKLGAEILEVMPHVIN
jgi:hypothetical protein